MKFSSKFFAATTEKCHWTKTVPAPYMRRSFNIDEMPDSAEITVCGLGFYEIYINGKHITKGKLSPYITNPHETLAYDNYDLMPYLKTGKNTLAFILGNGMQNCFGGYIWNFDKARFTSAPKIAFALEMNKGENSTVIEADENILTHPSPIVSDELRLGEIYDATLDIDGWNEVDYDDSNWNKAIPSDDPGGECLLSTAHPIVKTKELKAVKIWKEEDGGFVYDFGENCAGLTRLCISAEKGRKIKIQHCERLTDGKFNQDNLMFGHDVRPENERYIQQTEYTCKGEGKEEYTPFFTYYGFQYAKIWGIKDEEATADLLIYDVMNTELADRGDFSCSDEILNKLQQMTRRSTLANFWHFPTDCPHREKNGWTGDAALSAEHMLLNFDAEDNLHFWIRAICRSLRFEGSMYCMTPVTGWGGWAGPAWDAVLVYLPYYSYVIRGDLRAAKEVSGTILRYLHFLSYHLEQDGLVNTGLGDWCCPEPREAPVFLTSRIMPYDIAKKAAVLYRAMGMDAEEAYVNAFAEKMRKTIRENYCDLETMTFAGNCQTSQAMGIFYGLCDTKEEEQKAFSVLLDKIHEKDDHMHVGVLGGRVIFRVLADHGYMDLALNMMCRPDAPSYGYMVAMGYNTLLESTHTNIDSCNHHFWGDISAFMLEYIAGIRPNPELKIGTLNIAPMFPTKLDHAEGYYNAKEGKVESKWIRNGADIILTVTAPEGLKGNILAPCGYKFEGGNTALNLESGEYKIVKI
ncbi:MAG: hypothetical protein E7477_06690 [Ruminococcaceae bacterium]|nr:hypothetical protein [Oscillospiraceae bacterium]